MAWTCSEVGYVQEANKMGSVALPPGSETARAFSNDMRRGGCIPNLAPAPTAVGLLEIDGPYAFTCVRMDATAMPPSVGGGMKSYPYCVFARATDVVDAAGHPLPADVLRAIARASALASIPRAGSHP